MSRGQNAALNVLAAACTAMLALPTVAVAHTTFARAVAGAEAANLGAGNKAAGEAEAANIPMVGGRGVDVIFVRGFRIRRSLYDQRQIPLVQGYGELLRRPECQTNICGFVVFFDGSKWRLTNVQSGSEAELREMQQVLALRNTTLVLVHPSPLERTIPSF